MSLDPKSTQKGQKSYAAAVSSTKHNKDSQEKSNKAAAGKQEGKTDDKTAKKKISPVRAPTEEPMLTVYVYIVVDKSFKFKKEDKLLFCSAHYSPEMEITYFRPSEKNALLIEAKFSVSKSYEKQRGMTVEYYYAVKQQKNKIEAESARRYLPIPSDSSVKDLHIFEGHMSRVHGTVEWIANMFKSGPNYILKAWQTAALVLLDRVFEKWEPSNHQTMQSFIHRLNDYQWSFLITAERGVFINNATPFGVQVNEMIANKLMSILNGEQIKGSSERSANVSPVTVGLSVFQVCWECDVNIEIKGWAMLCRLVSSDSALRQLKEIQNTFPALQQTVIELMNLCADQLLSELVLLVPLLHSVSKPGSDSGRPSLTLDEPEWAGLQSVKYQLYRDRLRGFSDKRRMMLKMVEEQKHLCKERPHVLVGWLSLIAFEDVTEFAKLTGIRPEHLIQSLMYRMKTYEYSKNYEYSQNNLKVTERILTYVIKIVEQHKERIMCSGWLVQCCRDVLKSTCKIAQSPFLFKAAVLSFQLLLKIAEVLYEALLKVLYKEEKKKETKQLLTELGNAQVEFSEWRDSVLKQPLFQHSKLSYATEIELWDAFFGLECSIDSVKKEWLCSVDKDLRKRISALRDEERVQICVVEMTAKAIEKSHKNVQTCFEELCVFAIKTICQKRREGNLLRNWPQKPSPFLSTIIVESAARYGEDTVTQILNAESAVHVLLSWEHWSKLEISEDASTIMNTCQSTLGSLIHSLCQGDILLGHLQTILKHRDQFLKLYEKFKKSFKPPNISIDAKGLLSQRDKDVKAIMEQKKHMDFLLNMLGKISEMIHVPEVTLLEEEHKTDLQTISLNMLVGAQPCFSNQDLKEICSTMVLHYSADPQVLDMARQMYELQESNLILKSWMDEANALEAYMILSVPVQLNLLEVIAEIWQPSLKDFCQLGLRIAQGLVTFEQVDMAVDGCGDKGDGTRIKSELNLMAKKIENYEGLDQNWPELRFNQIQKYRQLHNSAESAIAIMRIRDRLNLQGDFSHIYSLTQLNEDSFKKKSLGSLSDELISARQKLSNIDRKHTACLEVFLKSKDLVDWVKKSIKDLRELKVFKDLASISAGENDMEIDRLASFDDAVMGYSPLLFFRNKNAGFEELIVRAQQVWDKLKEDEKLPTKLEESARCLNWLKGLRETHGSVEKSSLSKVSSINSSGVYHLNWPVGSSGKKSLGSILSVKVSNKNEYITYSLDELLELQNKLMLMSSKGEHGKEQVNKFTEIFEGVQRMGRVILQLCSSGNLFFQYLRVNVKCNPKKDPCINVHFPLLEKNVVYHGLVAEELQKACRSMEACYEDWCNYMSEMRSRYYALNHYTSEQIVGLCLCIKNIYERETPLSQQIRHLLNLLKPDTTLDDIRQAFEKGKESLEIQHQYQSEQDTGGPQNYDEMFDIYEDTENKTIDPFTEDMGEELSDLSISKQLHKTELQEDSEEDEMSFIFTLDQECQKEEENLEVVETLEKMWQDFLNDKPRYLAQYMDIEVLALFLSSLSDMNQLHIKRRLPSILQEGKPNLVLCHPAEMITTTLSFYMESPEQKFPSVDEVLMCTENTTDEEVEIFLRRCLGQGAPSSHKKVYTLFNPGLLMYDVSVALVEHFEEMEQSAGSRYRIVIVCPVNQDRYVPSFFSNYKLQAGLMVSEENAKEYLRRHLTAPDSHFQAYPQGLSSWMVSSRRPAVGKSLFVTRMFQRFKPKLPRASYLPVSLIEPRVDVDRFIKKLHEKESTLREQDPVLLHIDTAAVCCGLEEFLFKLLVLGCLSDCEGKLWRRNPAHLIVVEALLPDTGLQRQSHKESNQGLLYLLPNIHCRPPKEVKELALRMRHKKESFTDPLMDSQEFKSEGVQRPYQYLKRFNRNENLDHFKYQVGSVDGDTVDCLHHLLSNCGLKDPSWSELKHFTWFLNLQLKDCEISGFCDPHFFGDYLRGFKSFIVKFMIHMARDFASPSMDISDQSPSLLLVSDHGDDILARLTIRKRWENESHPYIFFNADHLTMTFLGFHIKPNPTGRTLNAIDPQSNKVLMGDVMSPDLFEGLQNQRISFSEDFDQLPRETKLKKVSFVVGATLKDKFDPDPTYELTADNVMKMLAIHMRFRCEIPVIIMGETGCGKTRLVKFLCDLQREGRKIENMKLVKVHGGTTADSIHKKVREAESLAMKNREKYNLDTILFFDEANTTEAIFAIKEVLCDKMADGSPLNKDSGLKIIAACNPYRMHTPKMIERLERAGLGYRVKAGETKDRLGKVPMRQLVYRVHPLPPSMMPLVWDFGQLNDSAELCYIKQIVQKQRSEHFLPLQCQSVIIKVLSASQRYMRSQVNECSFVSLRDVERSMRVLVWFYQHKDDLFPNSQWTDEVKLTLECLALSVGVCYYPSLEDRKTYLEDISQYFPYPLNSQDALEEEISSCQDFFLKNIHTSKTIAKNLALKENVFLMVVCIELRIPLFLVGKPGSSKSLAKTVVDYAMQRQASHCALFKKLKEVHMVSFQCSPHSSPEGIIATFRNCARFQKDKNIDEYVSVVVLDEIGLAEDSPQMPLKTLHPLLEDGCIDNESPDKHMKVGFVGISNWALDPAKMNRGIFVSRWDPSEKELVETANGICSSSNTVLRKIKHLLPKLAKGFLSICKNDKDQFFGLRDYYSLVKKIFNTVNRTDKEPSDSDLAEAILCNFSGQKDDLDPLSYFLDLFQNLHDVPRISTLKMIKQNLAHDNKEECRYLLLLTTNNAALYIVQQSIFSNTRPEIVFGSGFPKDQEYAQVCRNVSRVKMCMETGRTVILLNLLNLYESLYDALNQYYVYFSGQRYVDLGLGSHRVKCRVHPYFRLIVIEDQEKVYDKFPVPLKNRLEKHKVDRSTDLTSWQLRVLEKLKKWVSEFCQNNGSSSDFSPPDAFVGFHGDACASALLQALESREKQDHQKVRNGHADSNMSTEESISTAVPMEVDAENDMEENEQAHNHGEEIQSLENTPNDDIECAVADSDVQSDTQPKSPPNGKLVLVSGDDTEEDSKTTRTADDLGEDPGSREMDKNVNNIEEEDHGPNKIRYEEEEVYESAKCFLLNCATPDSVLRLKNSELGRQEVDQLQKLYFHQQGHHSLRDFINSHLNKTDMDRTRFIEITTFSSLLTKADERDLTQALDLDMERLLLLSVHQFDTEASFCSKIRCFMRNAHVSLHILLVQMDMEESLCKNELIASAKYCTMNELVASQSEDTNCYVVFITKLSRNASANKYIGFQGGAWLSVHIDDLRDTHDMSLDLSVLCGMPISKLLALPKQSDAMDIENQEGAIQEHHREESAYLHSLSLVRSCTQKAVSLLKDPVDKASRSLKRMHILLGLLENDPVCIKARFQEVLLSRLVAAQTQMEEFILNPDDWVNKEAKKRDALEEGGTLRHTLWRCLQGVLTPLLARILEVLDRDYNLDLLYGEDLSEGLVQFWLNIFSDEQILDLTMRQNSSAAEEEIDVQHNMAVDKEGRSCNAPFSWLIKQYCHNLWVESQFVQGIEQSSHKRIQQFVSAVKASRLGGYIKDLSESERLELGQKYLTDFVILTLKVKNEDEVRVFSAALSGCLTALQQTVGVPFEPSPAWIMAAAKHFSLRLDTLSHALQLQPQVAPLILKQLSQKDSSDMHEDILALGIFVEETKLQPVKSISACSSFLTRVELLQPCLQRAFSNAFTSLCSPGCLQHIIAIKSVWQGMLVLAAFIEQVVVKVNTHDQRLMHLTLEHCSHLKKLMEECPDLQSKGCLQKLIRILSSYHEQSISRELRFGVKCPVCLEDLTEPCVLQCEHVICLPCMKRCIHEQGTKCPKCRRDLPPEYQPTVSSNAELALKQHKEIRCCCNFFFLEVVSHFCLSKGQSPSDDMVELLFSLLISAQGGVYRTRELTPFLECVDQSPVVRSVLPKLLLQYSFEQVKEYIQTYLKKLEGHLLDAEDKTELYRLFVNCFQDSLLCVKMGETLDDNELQRRQQDDVKFLSRLARRQTVSREEQPAEFLLSMARLRMCLETVSCILPRAAGQKSGECADWEHKLLEQVKAVCEYSANDWYKIYLLRALNRQAGTDSLKAVINSTSYEWVFPKTLLQLQRSNPVEVDRFLCCGLQYSKFKNGVDQVLQDSNTDVLKAALQDVKSSVFLALALYRQVTCCMAISNPALRPGAQHLKILEDIVREKTTGHVRELCASLLSNPNGNLMPHLHVSARRFAERRHFQELLVHAIAAFHSGNSLLYPFHLITTRPQNMKEAFLPTMPDDHTSEVIQALGTRERNLTNYCCRNGHLVLVGECGRPVDLGNCATCGVQIGGLNHNPVSGFIQVSGRVGDQTRPGHILGDAAHRSEAPDRNLSMAESCVLRLFLHLAMLHGYFLNNQGIRTMIQPTVNNVQEFLWCHLEKDIEYLGKTLNLNLDDTAITVHLILNASADLATGRFQQTSGVSAHWSSRHDRERWEKQVCETLINPILKNLNRLLDEAQNQIASDDKLSSSPLMKVLKGDPHQLLALPSECPSHHDAFWTPPDLLTVEGLTHIVCNQAREQVPLLSHFLKTVKYVRYLAYLPDLAALLSDLIHVVPTDSTITISTWLHSLPAGQQRNTLTERLKTFFKVWNHLRMELTNNAAVGIDHALCEKDITMESSVQYISLSYQGPGSCLNTLISLLSETHNSLVLEACKLSQQDDSVYTVHVGELTENQLVLCHPEKELLPLVLAHCHYTLVKGQQTKSGYDFQAVEKQLHRHFIAGKPRIQTDTDKYLKRHHQDFSEVLKAVWTKIPQERLKGSVCSSIRAVLRSFTDVCDAVYVLEIGLRFLGKTGGDQTVLLLSYLKESLEMKQHISSSIAKALADIRLSHCIAMWQLLTCWRSELKLRKGQDPFPRLSEEFREKLSADERKELREFLDATDTEIFILELHEILLLKTSPDSYRPQWGIGSTLENHLEKKGANSLHRLETLSEEITLSKAAEVWSLAVDFKK
ncbi:E3 ubiquitin-protein ligase rnf213-beta [Trichomycterus rosablanca]|uniref:E3 ubiquitin-protein ligase rnf213-beta n=1 Tax=Trichomycterus rosablanca TaxID=2290929 RepID=UPI002F3592CA